MHDTLNIIEPFEVRANGGRIFGEMKFIDVFFGLFQRTYLFRLLYFPGSAETEEP